MNKVKGLLTKFEKALGIKFSKEQSHVLLFKPTRPLLVNACAGSGKTTLIIIKMLLLVASHQINPVSMLGITFSHDAAQHMRDKYQSMQRQLLSSGVVVPHAVPHFSTFHALFYHMVAYIKGVNRLPILHNNPKLTYKLLKSILSSKANTFVSKHEQLKKYMSLRNGMIAAAYSYDGIDTVYNTYNKKHEIDTRRLVADALTDPDSEKQSEIAFQSYMNVNTVYNQWKKDHQCIDFNDMEMILYKAFINHNENQIKHIKSIGNRYQLCFMDEFQDINPIQYFLMHHILNSNTWNQITVVGDDDQSIYGFRGSDPHIIMQFQKENPKAKQLNLSINYRTGDHILDATRPMIEKNKFRLGGKKLLSHNTSDNNIVKYMSNNDKHLSSDAVLLKLMLLLDNKDVDNNNIAVLVRYNFYKAILADWFANHKYYVYSNVILQNTKEYKNIMYPVKAIIRNKLNYLYYTSSKLTYGYRKHILNVLKNHYAKLKAPMTKKMFNKMTLTSYLKLALKYDMASEWQSERYTSATDEDIFTAYKICYKSKKGTLDKVLDITNHLESSYFDFMVQHHYMNKEHLNLLLSYLHNEMSHYKNGHKFLTEERNKRMHVLLSSSKNKIHLLTIHQSKGLQFPYVFLYNLDQSSCTLQMIYQDKYYSPSISYNEFLQVTKYLSAKELDLVDDDSYALHGLVKTLKSNDKDSLENNKDWYKHLWSSCKQNCAIVEASRRLLYVGCTRASHFLAFNMAKDASPFLSELQVPKRDYVLITKNNKLVPMIQDKQTKEKQVQAKMERLQVKMNKLRNNK